MKNKNLSEFWSITTLLVFAFAMFGLTFFMYLMVNEKGTFAPTKIHIQDERAVVELGSETLEVSVMRDEIDRKRGLSGYPSLAPNEGMLFVFPESGIYGMWMKDMQFAIDIIWLDEEFRVVHIQEDARPESYPETFRSTEPALFVLEASSGFVANRGISIGDIATISDVVSTNLFLEEVK